MTAGAENMLKLVREEVTKWVIRTALLVSVSAMLWVLTPLSDKVTGIWNSPETLQRVLEDIETLTAALNRVSGEDRVIRQPSGQSYVTEPVSQGDIVVLNLVLQRTQLGRSCKFIGGQSLFSDYTGVAVAGPALPPINQVESQPTRFRIEIEAPAALEPGRIELYLALQYECSGKSVFDKTDTVTYRLLEST